MSKVFWKDIFGEFQETILENKLTFVKKMYCIQQLSCNAKLDRFYAIYLVLTNKIARKWHLWQNLLNSTSKNLAMIA